MPMWDEASPWEHLSDQSIVDTVTSAGCLALREWDGVKDS